MNRRNFLRGSATVGAAVVAVKAMPKDEIVLPAPEQIYDIVPTETPLQTMAFTMTSAPLKDRGMATPLSERDWWHRG